MRNGCVDDRNLHEILLGVLNTLSDGGSYLIGFSKTITNNAVLVTHNHNRGEAEVTTTLSDLSHSLDGDQSVFQFKIRCLYSLTFVFAIVFQLENKATFTGSVGQTFNPTVIEVTSTVKRDGGDSLLLGTLSDRLSYDGGGLDSGLALALCGKNLIVGSGGHERHAFLIVHNLDVDLLVASEDNHSWPLSCSIDMLTDAVMDSSSSFNSIQCHIYVLLLFSSGSLTGLATKLLAGELDTLALVRFRLAE